MQAYLTKKNLLIGAGVAVGVALMIVVKLLWGHSRTVAVAKPPKATAPIVNVQENVAKDLEWANEMSGSGVGLELSPVHDLFAQGRRGARAFADDALGWGSKWKLVTDYVSKGHEHGKFLQQQFSKRIFSPEQLQAAVEAVVTAYMRHLDDVDSQLLVRLEADLSGIPAEQFTPGIDRDAIRQVIAEALRQAREASTADFGGMVGREIASLIAGQVLTTVALQLAASTGILSAGAASGAVTFGAGLVVGVVADCIVSWAYDKAYDPVGTLTKRVNGQLDRLEQSILRGTAEKPGLEQRLREYSLRRRQSRESAISGAILVPVRSTAL